MSTYARTRIVTPRLVLRLLRIDDAAALHHIYQDPEVMHFLNGPYAGTVDDLRERLAFRITEHERDGFGLYATELRETGELMGRCGHMRWDIEGRSEMEVGYLIARPHWGRGYATEAALALIDRGFDELALERIVSLIHPENVASQRVAEHNGLRLEREVTVEGIAYAPLFLYVLEKSQRPAPGASSGEKPEGGPAARP